MKHWIWSIWLGVFLALGSCDFATFWSSPPYFVYEIDGQGKMLGISTNRSDYMGRVEPEIQAVGEDKTYIVAQAKSDETGVVEYFFIKKDEDKFFFNADEIVQGPFSQIEYQRKVKELNLPKFRVFFD